VSTGSSNVQDAWAVYGRVRIARAAAQACLGGLRLVGRSPGMAVTAIATLAVGIGATTALATVVSRVVLEPLPFPASAEIVQVWRSELPALTYGSASYARYLDWRAAQEPFAEFGAWAPRSVTITGTGDPERLGAGIASSAFFRVLALAPTLGRWIDDQDDRPGSARVAVISEGLWRRRFGASAGVVGATVHLDGEPHAIVGVAPEALSEVWRPDVWLPLAQHADAANRGNNFLLAFGRLRAGTTLPAARQSLARLAEQMRRAHPDDDYTFTARDLHDVVTEGVSRRLWVVLGATVLLLVIACTNVANLLLARAVAMERELAVRASLGARPPASRCSAASAAPRWRGRCSVRSWCRRRPDSHALPPSQSTSACSPSARSRPSGRRSSAASCQPSICCGPTSTPASAAPAIGLRRRGGPAPRDECWSSPKWPWR
jgi:hypothetical protein